MTQGYALVTDTCADLPREFVEQAGLEVLSFPYVVDGVEHLSHPGQPMHVFYDAMRSGSTPSTTAIPVGTYLNCFMKHAETGTEVVFLAFSSALSSSFEYALLARDAVLKRHPGASIRIVDTQRASVAQAALVIAAVKRRNAGATAAELEKWALEARQKSDGYFTADTLEHLRRGGRVSDLTAVAGAVLDIRPMLTFSDEGGLVLGRVVRGRKRSMRLLVEHAASAPPDVDSFIIGHADCADDAAKLETMIAEARPGVQMMRCDIGPVIGSHTGPGMLAVVYLTE